MSQAPFVIQPRLTAISLTYRNPGPFAFIADRVLPRVPVASSAFKWSKYTMADGFTIPDTRVGRKSKPNEIDWTATEQSDATVNFALDDAIPYEDIENARAAQATQGVMPIDPEARSTTLLTDLIALDRERRVSGSVFALATYPAANRQTLAGATQWSDFASATSQPVDNIMVALDVPVVRPNVLVFGQQTWTKFRQHPKVTAAIVALGGNAAVGGSVVDRQAVANLFEVEEVMVGPSFYNTAKPGQTASLGRVWGKHMAMFYRSPVLLSTDGTITFGFTGEWGNRIAGTVERDPNIGMRGGTRVRVGESVKEVIAASDVGYFFENAVA